MYTVTDDGAGKEPSREILHSAQCEILRFKYEWLHGLELSGMNYFAMCMYVYRVSQKECGRLRESVPYVKYTDITQNIRLSLKPTSQLAVNTNSKQTVHEADGSLKV